MKAIILAAGRGTRLMPIIKDLPKCLVEIYGKTLLERSLDNLKKHNIKEVIIVIGYLGELIKEKFGKDYKGIKINYIRNQRYSETGSMYSFSLLKDLINEDVLLLESDLLYDDIAIKTLLDSNLKDAILIAGLLNSGDDVYICTNENKQIIDLGKNISTENKNKAAGALVGISKISKEFLMRLFKKAEEDYKDNKLKSDYEVCIFETSRLGYPVNAILHKDLNWIEIDNENDLKRAKEEVYPKIKE